MSLGIKPLGARVVIKKDEALEKTEGGLILFRQCKGKTSAGGCCSSWSRN